MHTVSTKSRRGSGRQEASHRHTHQLPLLLSVQHVRPPGDLEMCFYVTEGSLLNRTWKKKQIMYYLAERFF